MSAIEDVILVTRDLDATIPDDRPIVPYFVGKCSDAELQELHLAICKCWNDLAALDEDGVVAGALRGRINLSSDPRVFWICQALRDLAYEKGLNCVHFIPGYGPILWGVQVWVHGSVLPIIPSYKLRSGSYYKNTANVVFLRELGVRFSSDLLVNQGETNGC